MKNVKIKLSSDGFGTINCLLDHQLDNVDADNLWIIQSLTDEISFYEFANESYNRVLSISETDNYKVYSLFKDFFYVFGHIKEWELI